MVKKLEKHKLQKPDYSYERNLLKKNYKTICGVDEVGRGSLSGPVVAAAVILDPKSSIEMIDDSKRLNAQTRNFLYKEILQTAHAISISTVCAAHIDRWNIRIASLRAMRQAIHSLAISADYALIDGRDVPENLSMPAKAIIKGDQKSLSIAAASIVAKVFRDTLMKRSALYYQDYGFEKNVGYGTKDHREILEKNGPIPGFHRFSFAPIKKADI